MELQSESIKQAKRIFIKPGQNQEFEERGYVVDDCLGPAELASLTEIWNNLPNDLATMPFSSTAFSNDLSYRREVNESVLRILEKPVLALLDGYRLSGCGFVVKRPGEASEVELHQDPNLLDESSSVGLVIWIPLVDVDTHNGCLRVVPGSHHLNPSHRESMEISFPYRDLITHIEQNYLADIPMKAGQIIVYSQALFHSSPPNLSSEVRVAAIGICVPEQAKLLACFRDPERYPGQMAVYAVDEEFFLNYMVGDRPADAALLELVEDKCDPADEERLRSVLKGPID